MNLNYAKSVSANLSLLEVVHNGHAFNILPLQFDYQPDVPVLFKMLLDLTHQTRDAAIATVKIVFPQPACQLLYSAHA